MYIGREKLGLTFKETGRLTLTMFNRLYKHYKKDWDFEQVLIRSKMTYEEAYERQMKAEEWL